MDIVKLGFLYPLGGAEYEYYHFEERLDHRVRTYLTGVRIFGEGSDHDPEHLQRTGALDNLTRAAIGLKPLSPDAALWACTSGSFIDGRAHAEKQAAAIAATLGCPASSTSLAFVHAARHLGLQRLALLATYSEPAAQAFANFLSEFGFEIGPITWLDAPAGPDAAAFSIEKVMATLADMDLSSTDGVLIPDTAMPGFELVRRAEATFGLPVLAANQVSIWEGLRLAEASITLADHGRLFI
ncbi:hypothetical protein JHL16_23115 [Aestuariivirga sp. YIM B02566]|uniref:Uncharacterized protein n=1 Tax=Taklimakanibacter albus TaxID=2800327 RepID=A0ACC5R9C7_9HYPH|nr:hypothetical protein [Aestuariivirga sp. YIM B02566]MBK1869270.1 hypothetical protein [Aestuariivirga sp. YIM B02566]